MADFVCSNGHEISVPNGYPIKRCLAYQHNGECEPRCARASCRCKGKLERVGEGSRDNLRCEGAGQRADRLSRSPNKGRCEFCGKAIALTKDGKLRFHERKKVDA